MGGQGRGRTAIKLLRKRFGEDLPIATSGDRSQPVRWQVPGAGVSRDLVETRRQVQLSSSEPGGPLAETIPDFHNTRARFNVLQQAIDADVCNRAAEVAPEIAFVNEREGIIDTLLDLQKTGEIPIIVTHNDTKFKD